ncbi:MAG TPA: hypothetical protein VMF13_08355, partial [Luteitalea sp.]|nr:hypothetical protein [Luteitalea sp.]
MALVPFPINSAGVPPPASAGRGLGAGRPTLPGAQNASRAPQRAADGRPATAPAAKGKAAFAQVLAAARADEKPTVEASTTPSGKSRSVRGDTDARVATRGTREPDDAPTVVAASTQDDSRAVSASSWLLLALGQRSMGSSEHDTAVVSPDDQPTSGDDVVAPVDPAAGHVMTVVPVAIAAPPVATPAPAPPGTAVDGGGVVFVSGTEVDPLAAFTAPALVATASSGTGAVAEDPWLTADGAEAALEGVVAPPVNEMPSVDPAAASSDAIPTMSKEQEGSAASVTATPGSPNTPAADAVARWRAAARALGGAVRAGMTPTDTATPDGAAVAGPNVVDGAAATLAGRGPGAAGAAPTTAVQELVTLVSSLVEPTGAKAQQAAMKAQLPAVDSAVPETAVVPGVRTADVLMRLAQAGAELAPPRVGRADLPDASVFSQMMASATPVSTPQTPVATAATAVPALPPAVGEQVNAHIVSSLKMQWKDGIGEAKL